MSFDRIVIARLLFSLVTVGWGVLTVVADFNHHASTIAIDAHPKFTLSTHRIYGVVD